jgi:hypothetical protein
MKPVHVQCDSPVVTAVEKPVLTSMSQRGLAWDVAEVHGQV